MPAIKPKSCTPMRHTDRIRKTHGKSITELSMAMKGVVCGSAGVLHSFPDSIGLPSAGDIGAPGGCRADDHQRQRSIAQPQPRREHACEEIGGNRDDQNRDREMIDGRVDMPFFESFREDVASGFSSGEATGRAARTMRRRIDGRFPVFITERRTARKPSRAVASVASGRKLALLPGGDAIRELNRPDQRRGPHHHRNQRQD